MIPGLAVQANGKEPLAILHPAALQKEGEASWRYGLEQIADVYYLDGIFKAFQIRDVDVVGGVEHLQEVFWEVPYNVPIRMDWTMKVDQATAEWQMASYATHAVLQMLATVNGGYLGSSINILVQNGNFIFNRTYTNGAAPTTANDNLYSVPVEQGRLYKISVRVLPHISAGKVEFWLDGVLVGARYNVETAFTSSNYIYVYGLYRWQPFTGNIRVLHSQIRTGDFEFLG